MKRIFFIVMTLQYMAITILTSKSYVTYVKNDHNARRLRPNLRQLPDITLNANK